jgi:hypothetical protein
VKVEGFVAPTDVAFIKPGAKVLVTLNPETHGADAAARTYMGKLVFVDVKATPSAAQTVRVWAEVDNIDNALRANMMPKTMTILPAGTE